MSHWKESRLGSVVTQVKESVNLLPNSDYKQITIRMNHRGVTLRGVKRGSEIGSKQYLATHNQFIISRIDARNGAMGLVPVELEGAIVTNDFLLFTIDSSIVLPQYFDYLTRTAEFDRACVACSEGSTNRVRLKLDRFLDIPIELPPIDEQQRIVSILNALKGKVNEAKQLREQTVNECIRLKNKFVDNIFTDEELYVDSAPLAYVVDERNSNVSAINFPERTYLSLEDIEANTGKILNKRTAGECSITGSAVVFDERTVLYSKLRPYLNKVIAPDFAGIGTTELIVLKPNLKVLTREFLAHYIRSPKVVKYLDGAASGTKMPRANMKMFRSLTVPLPPLEEQHRIVAEIEAFTQKINQLKAYQLQTQKELDALFPSLLDKAFKGEL